MTRVRLLLLLGLLVAGIASSEMRGVDAPYRHAAGSTAPGGGAGQALPRNAYVEGVIAQAVPDNNRAAIVNGIVFGQIDNLSPELRQQFRDSGLWHLLAASGQNIALVIGLMATCSWLVGGGRMLASCTSLFAIPLYVLLAGAGPSITRAGIMGAIGVIAWMSGRPVVMWNSVLLSAIVIVWLQPGSHRHLGFQLSYACVCALLLWATRATRHVSSRTQLPMPLVAVGVATFICSTVTMPILLLQTGSAPLTSSIANIVAVPLAGVILIIGLCAAGVSYVSPFAAQVAFELLGYGAAALISLSAGAVQLPMATIERAEISTFLRGQTYRIAAHLPRISGGAAPHHAQAAVTITMLDVGQGDAIAVQAGSTALLIDTGPPDGGVTRQLKAVGIRKLQGVIVTHDQLDHGGAIRDVAHDMDPEWIGIPAHGVGNWRSIRGIPQRVTQVCHGARLPLSLRVQVTVLNPRCDGKRLGNSGDPANDGGVVIEVITGGFRALLAADVEGVVTTHIADHPVSVLKVAHHGSSDPQLGRLLEILQPSIALISVSSNNSYGHPTTSTIRELEKAGADIFRTDRDGTVGIASDGRSIWRTR